MSEREIADLKLKVMKQKNYIEYLKQIIKKQDHEINDLTLLLNTKIRFRNEVKKCQKKQ